MISERRISIPMVAVILAPFILFAPLLLTGKTIFWGTVSLQFLPWRYIAWETLKMGNLPLWNPLVGMGAPLLANYQSGLFYPPNWLVLLAGIIGGISWAAWLQTLLVVLHLCWGGIGMVLLVRKIGFGELSQAICGLSFALSGYFVARSGFLSINAALAWLPWVIYTVTLVAYGGINLHVLTVSTLVISLFLMTGHAQTEWYTLLLAAMWAAFLGWEISYSHNNTEESIVNQTPWASVFKSILHNWIGLALAAFGAILLTSIQLIPTAELLLQSQRSNAVDYDFAMTYSFWPWRLITLFAPTFFGSPVSGDYWGYGNYWEDTIYIGLLPVVFAIYAAISTIKNRSEDKQRTLNHGLIRKDLVIFLLLISAISLVMALGKNTPIFPWLHAHIPSFNLFQAPTRYTLWAVFSLILLAGIGIDNLQKPKGRALYWTRLGTAGALAVSLGSGITWYLLGDVSPTFIRATAIMGLNGFFVGVIVLLAPDKSELINGMVKRHSLWVWAVVCLVGCDLLLAGWNINPGISVDYYKSANPSVDLLRQLEGGERIYLPLEDEYELKFNRFMRFDTYQIDEDWSNLRATLLPDLNLLEGISSVNNFEPLLPARYARWMEALNNIQIRQESKLYLDLLNLMNIGAIETLDSGAKIGVRFAPIVNPNSRVRWIPCAHVVGDAEEAWNQLFNSGIDPYREIIIEGDADGEWGGCDHQGGGAVVKWVEDGPNRILVTSETPSNGWILLSDVWYPGWRAEIDGVPTKILKANYLFRGLPVPAGQHEIVFEYNPFSFRIGLGISFLGWLGLVLVWLIRLRIRRNRNVMK